MSSSYDEKYAEVVVDFVVHLGGSTTDVEMVIVECSCCGGWACWFSRQVGAPTYLRLDIPRVHLILLSRTIPTLLLILF